MINKWTLALAAAGVVSLGSVAQAEEKANQVLTALSSTTLSGYVETSAIWKPGTGTAIPGAIRAFDGTGRMDGFNFHVAQLVLEKPLDEGNWSAGYKADLLFGPDATWYAGSITSPGVAVGGADELGIKQAYVTLRAPVGNGLDAKLGVFDSIIGYESFESGNNPNFSRSIAFSTLQPRQHTGLLLSYHVNDVISVAGGIANTYRGAINSRPARLGVGTVESEKTYMGAITITLPEAAGALAGSAIYAGIVDGLSAAPVSGKDITSYYAGTTLRTPVEGLSVGGAFDYREDGANAVTPFDNWAWAASLYTSYQATEKLKVNARAEWANGSDGTFYDRNGDGLSTAQEELLSITGTIDYSLWAGVITRAEVRWDHSLKGDRPFSAAAAGIDPDRNALTVAANVIYKF